MKIIVPPIKCQGIKTRLVPTIRAVAQVPSDGTWIEPFCGSCVVALNLQPGRALLADTNQHLFVLYTAIQRGEITAQLVREFLEQAGEHLRQGGADYYYEVRDRFNTHHSPLDFLFLNRSCYNGLMRFNRNGQFNVPFGHKPERFRQAYITKIVHQVQAFQRIVQANDWQFAVASFEDTLSRATAHDFIYADPPYLGRHTDYFNGWQADDEARLADLLKAAPCGFVLSTWHSNRYRQNTDLNQRWPAPYAVQTIEHFYHVGPSQERRAAITEALVVRV